MLNGKRSTRLFLLLAAFAGTFLTNTPSVAQERVLHNFGSKVNEGITPFAGLVFDAAGNLYGTTASGGTVNLGTLFELSPAAKGGWFERTLFNFQGATSGDHPTVGLTIDDSGNLYGTTQTGGSSNLGVAFELRHWPNGGWSEKVLHDFSGAGAPTPPFGMIFDAAGNLYGTAGNGGAHSFGAVFKLSPLAGGSWKATVLYSFGGSAGDGIQPVAGLVFDTAGNLYGTTSGGGAYGAGTVFELSPTVTGSWMETVLHSFGSGVDGAQPVAGLIVDAAGNLYGTTKLGGAHKLGSAFELSPQADGTWMERVIHSFGGSGNGKDARYPFASLVFGRDGGLYGTTLEGGAYGASHQSGTVFELIPATGGGWTETIKHSFGHGSDGANPYAGLILDASGNFYGTTSGGGTHGHGTVFEMTP